MSLLLDRHWLLTSTFYGNRLPGDRRGFVSHIERNGERIIRNQPGTAPLRDEPLRERSAKTRMRGPLVRMQQPEADAIADQFVETCRYKGWRLLAASIMADHVHLAVSFPGDPDPAVAFGTLKSYASRAANRQTQRQQRWTKRSSTRKLPTEAAVLAAAVYVRDQSGRLAYRSEADWEPFAERHESLPEIGEYAPRLVDD